MRIKKAFLFIATISVVLTLSHDLYGYMTEDNVAEGYKVLRQKTIDEMVKKEKVAIEVHGIGEGGGWAHLRLPDKYYYYHFKWEKGSFKGMTGGVIIDAAQGLASLILDIHKAFKENNKTAPEIVIVAHSMGGEVAKAVLNFFSKGEISRVKAIASGMVKTKRAFDRARKEITVRFELLKKESVLVDAKKLVKSLYTLGTPGRPRFPFNEKFLDDGIAEELFVLFSTGDKVQILAGNRGVKPGRNRFNIRVRVKEKDSEKIKDPGHPELVRGTMIVDGLLIDVTKQNIESVLSGKDIMTGTVVMTFAAEKTNTSQYEFSKKPPKTRWFHKFRMGSIVF
ncbi:hypothetical protein KAU11_02750 [Candidatus Babeliales bacterium]|nr:hypothetical protein [Candidatus Babeliales bacterium]